MEYYLWYSFLVMARYTSVYSSFLIRIKEIEILRRHAQQKERVDAVSLKDDINALCRGAIVLLSAHLEAYIKELGELVVDSIHAKKVPRVRIAPCFYYYISKVKIDAISNTTDPRKKARKVFSFLNQDIEYWSQDGPFPQPIPSHAFNMGFSNPAFKKISTYFKRFGYENYKNDLARVLKAEYQFTVTMVDNLVDVRNKIAHGDPTSTKTPSEVGDITDIIKKYCATTDNVFASWCKQKMCAIR